MSMCCFRCSARPNEFPHFAHLCTFSPVWLSMCLLSVPAWPNDFAHSEQVCVFSPVWVSICFFRMSARPNDFWHWTQVFVFSLLCINICIIRVPNWSNDFLHSEQMWILSLPCVRVCPTILLQFDDDTHFVNVCWSKRSEPFLWKCTDLSTFDLIQRNFLITFTFHSLRWTFCWECMAHFTKIKLTLMTKRHKDLHKNVCKFSQWVMAR